MDHVVLERALAAADDNTLLERRRDAGVERFAFALFAGAGPLACGAFATVRLGCTLAFCSIGKGM